MEEGSSLPFQVQGNQVIQQFPLEFFRVLFILPGHWKPYSQIKSVEASKRFPSLSPCTITIARPQFSCKLLILEGPDSGRNPQDLSFLEEHDLLCKSQGVMLHQLCLVSLTSQGTFKALYLRQNVCKSNANRLEASRIFFQTPYCSIPILL